MSWPLRDFTSVVRDKTGGNQKFPRDKYLKVGRYPIIDQGDSFIGGFTDINDVVRREKDVIVFGDHTKVFKYVDFDFCLGADGVKVLEPIDEIDTKFLFHYLRTLKLPDVGYSRHFKFLIRNKIPVPPLPTQRRIAEILDTADALRRKDQELLAKYNELAEAIFIDMFGDPVRNEKGWEMGTIRDLTKEVKYGTSSPAKENGKFPYLRMNNITYSGEWSFNDIKYIDVNLKEFEKYSLKKGDVVFNRTNSKELVGKTAVFDRDDDMIIAGYLIRVRVNERGNPYYLSGFLNSIFGKSILKNMCKNIIGMANINAQELQDITIPIPPIHKQNEYEMKLKSLNANKINLYKVIKYSDSLFNYLLQQAFGGKLVNE